MEFRRADDKCGELAGSGAVGLGLS